MALELTVAEAKRSTDPVSKNWGVLSQPMRALIRSMRLRRRFGAGLPVSPSPGARRSIPQASLSLENLAIGSNQDNPASLIASEDFSCRFRPPLFRGTHRHQRANF
ncbi:hypothetical protein N7499_005168 [Penicillium canescens]|uniref:Uncharacterized protein n=1 Tax=Penicillium canescens TaxID=5083 RepID=A0AAD6I1E5_PENCN|nr:uncharacterized protein N7446_004339 [Penicillium canescens]KAJ6027061.1 hypothetical protein N7460_011878 [Penicillium canescens]KAJ6040345.1 hypothetical protein N7444_009250 [Penicillium canescens]KAJ6067302.1 hypothetical protein N7446_004339 [Penicillium canescens]KAJ6085539.1 hypothetical protein N7499_005168 [Penicillium canescens]KAJ6162313.1 hypothetical protein N7485_010543 [Penicillium canescens]